MRGGLDDDPGVDGREAVRARASAPARPGRSRCSSSRCRRRACCAAPRSPARQIAADDSLLALKVNGEDLSPDHGYPARVIVPALPGVHNTKWVGRDDLPEGVTALRARYGASPIHLLAHLVLLPLVAWALLTVLDFRAASNVVLWLVGAVILHDFVLLPAVLRRWIAPARVAAPGRDQLRPRPAGLSLLVLLVFWGTIRGKGAGTYARVSGLEYDGYGARWLLLTGGAVRDLAARSTCCGRAGPGGFPRRSPRPAACSERDPQRPALAVEVDRVRSADRWTRRISSKRGRRWKTSSASPLTSVTYRISTASVAKVGRPDPRAGLPRRLSVWAS